MAVDINKVKKKKRGTDALPFSRSLKKLMDERNLTISQVATLAETGKSVVGSWLSGAVPFDLKAVHRLSRSLGVPFDTLILGVDGNGNEEDLSSLYEDVPLYTGLCRISKLIPKKGRSK